MSNRRPPGPASLGPLYPGDAPLTEVSPAQIGYYLRLGGCELEPDPERGAERGDMWKSIALIALFIASISFIVSLVTVSLLIA